MIKRAKPKSDGVKVTFTLPGDIGPVSVVGEFNDWDPHANPLKKRSNGTRSVSVVLPVGAETSFRYLGEAQGFFDDLRPGDHVVHFQHGVARYGGMVKRAIGGVERDYLLLEYRGDDKLYVPSD